LTLAAGTTYQKRIGGSRSAEIVMKKIMGAVLALGLLSAAGVDRAAAQVVSDPNQIRYCLCQQQYVLALQDNVNVRRDALNSSQRQQNSLNNQVATRRAAINVYDNGELDAFKQLLQQRDASIGATAGASDAYDRAANAYNDAVAGYNSTCAGRSYDQNALQLAQSTLACARPAALP
jgi:hypothetical protein